MNEADRIWDELEDIYSQWGITEIPFSESASILGKSQLRKVFTGRSQELRNVFSLLKGKERRRILVYGWIGIGKTAFILEVLDVLKRKATNTLTAYISLPANTDLATTALIALAREMKEDKWAQQLLNQMGLLAAKSLKQREITGKLGIPGSGVEYKEKNIDINQPLLPELSFEDLLKRALEKYDRVIIAIDDLDKQDPATVKQLLLNAQGMLKSGAWFILTGHPSGLTRDILMSERGLFDLAMKLEPLEQDIMYKMLVNYLNSVRSEDCQYSVEDPKAVEPFTPETAKMLCDRSSGVPRWLNRLGSYVLQKASALKAETITPEVLQEGFIYTDQQVKGQLGLKATDLMVLDLILEKDILSDENISLEELQKLKVQEFSELLPILDKLTELDLIRRLPNEQAMEFTPTPLLLPHSGE
ncbi:MAG: ATP-binding protein [Gomphosphaeria aponina SAG 52.96 = DSM 107014]|uniref:ATP-binding protein n=1 Tax=Gomphosphaeria aponina SAG 52.96 = DSM 107014 TaxID=1521640 RepID=A0A941GQA8_9CHRO|nr:ATP-binding protein [Gomphosphaeria aponina SAG 52.96 = DSM 107014]